MCETEIGTLYTHTGISAKSLMVIVYCPTDSYKITFLTKNFEKKYLANETELNRCDISWDHILQRLTDM